MSLKYLMPVLVTGLISCGSGAPNGNNLPTDSLATDTSVTNDTGTVASQPMVSDTGSLAGTWYLVAALPSDTAAGRVPVITFNATAKNFGGNTGCNTMRGTYESTDSTLNINEQIITTKMACPGYNEDAFLKSLPKTTTYRFENGMLILLADKAELSRWTRTPAKPTTKTA
ncbi:MAG: META domain-containing protein [Flavitalea sp.]